MSETMIERVARAIALQNCIPESREKAWADMPDSDLREDDYSSPSRDHVYTDMLTGGLGRDSFRRDARAAIEAMKDAPFDVLDAGVCCEIDAWREEAGQTLSTLERAHVSGQSINALWSDMIDAALTPTTPS